MNEEILNLGDRTDNYLRLYIQKDIPITREQANEINEYKCELKNIINELETRLCKAQDFIRNESYLNDAEIDELCEILEGDK